MVGSNHFNRAVRRLGEWRGSGAITPTVVLAKHSPAKRRKKGQVAILHNGIDCYSNLR